MESMLCCPNCGQPLKKDGRTFCCPKRHSFDIAAAGYCNLLLSSRSGDKVGDDKQMVAARRRFLDRGYYQPLADAVCERVSSILSKPSVVIDAGCGEGYYTRQLAERLDQYRTLLAWMTSPQPLTADQAQDAAAAINGDGADKQ